MGGPYVIVNGHKKLLLILLCAMNCLLQSHLVNDWISDIVQASQIKSIVINAMFSNIDQQELLNPLFPPESD